MTDDVEARLQKIEARQDALASQVESLVELLGGTLAADDVDDRDVLAELQELRDRTEQLEDLTSNLQDIGGQKTSKEQKLAALVTYADRIRSDNQDLVGIDPKTMAGVAGVTERYAYTLIDELHSDDAFPWAADARELSRRAPTDTRALVVDFGYLGKPVQEDAERLNKFINATGGEGASA